MNFWKQAGLQVMRWSLLGITLVACRPMQPTTTSLPYPVQVGQACGDVMMPVDTSHLGRCNIVEFRLQFPTPVQQASLQGVKLVNLQTGQQIPLRVLSEPDSVWVSLVAEEWKTAFSYDSAYLLVVESVKDDSGKPLQPIRLNLHTKQSPYFFRWLSTQVNAAPHPYVEATLSNTTGEDIPAGAVAFS